MLHIYNLPLDSVKQYIDNHTMAVLVSLALCILIAYMVSIAIKSKRIISKIKRINDERK